MSKAAKLDPNPLIIKSPGPECRCPVCKLDGRQSPLVPVEPVLHQLVGGMWAHYLCIARLRNAIQTRRNAQASRRGS